MIWFNYNIAGNDTDKPLFKKNHDFRIDIPKERAKRNQPPVKATEEVASGAEDDKPMLARKRKRSEFEGSTSNVEGGKKKKRGADYLAVKD